jgi:hypothetical protein
MNPRAVQSSLILLLLAVAACAGGPRQRPVEGGPVDAGPGSLTAARKYLQGRWTLESFNVFPPGKPAITLWVRARCRTTTSATFGWRFEPTRRRPIS